MKNEGHYKPVSSGEAVTKTASSWITNVLVCLYILSFNYVCNGENATKYVLQ